MATSEQNLSSHQATNHDSVKDVRVGIVVSEWNNEITNNLLKGANQFLLDCGLNEDAIVIKKVPGSFELPLGAQWLIESHQLDGVICLGSVIRGETDHFTFVCQTTASGINEVSLKYSLPVIFGVLTDNTKQQAIDRSGGKHGNKGVEAAATLIEMLKLKAKLD